VVVARVDERDVDRLPGESARAREPAEAAADDDDLGRDPPDFREREWIPSLCVCNRQFAEASF